MTHTKIYHENLYSPAVEIQAHPGLRPGLEHKTKGLPSPVPGLHCRKDPCSQVLELVLDTGPGAWPFPLWWQCLPALKFSVYHYKAVELGSSPLWTNKSLHAMFRTPFPKLHKILDCQSTKTSFLLIFRLFLRKYSIWIKNSLLCLPFMDF